MTVTDNSENEQLRKVNEEQSKKISNFQREITILEEKLKEKDAELEKRKTELSHLRHSSKLTPGLFHGVFFDFRLEPQDRKLAIDHATDHTSVPNFTFGHKKSGVFSHIPI